jgi:hypothetical protein
MKSANTRRAVVRACARWVTVAALAGLAAFLSACATPPAAVPAPAARAAPVSTAESVYGIRVDGLHLSAHGHILDLRYRVLDPAKAALLLDARRKVHLIDDARNAKLGVPESPVIGGMRQTSRNRVIYTDRDYFILFVNPGRSVRTGDTVRLAVDGTGIAELSVQ